VTARTATLTFWLIPSLAPHSLIWAGSKSLLRTCWAYEWTCSHPATYLNGRAKRFCEKRFLYE